LVGTPPEHLVKMTEACGHLSLFLGTDVLGHAWPNIARFLVQELDEPQLGSTRMDAPGMGARGIQKSVG